MRALAVFTFVLTLALLVACSDSSEPENRPGARIPSARLTAEAARKAQVIPVADFDGEIRMDGSSADAAWKTAREIAVPLDGPGPDQVSIRVVRNKIGLYFLLKWRDKDLNRGNVCRFEEPGVWKIRQGEDGALFFFPPPAGAETFRAKGVSAYEKDGQLFNSDRTGFADVWFWGAQTTRPHNRARDHWLPSNQTLRGDSQPSDSDNMLNWSVEHKGPVAVPVRVSDDAKWYLPKGNRQQFSAAAAARLATPPNFGWTVSAVLHRMLKKSRGDVYASSRHGKNGWVLELGRRLDTGWKDDHKLGTNTPFAIAIYDGTAMGARIGEYGLKAAISRPLELRFLSDT